MAEEKVTKAAEEVAAAAETASVEKKPAKAAAEKKPATKKAAAPKAEDKKPAAEKKPAAKKAPAKKADDDKKPAAKKASGKTVIVKSVAKVKKQDVAPEKSQVKILLKSALTGCSKPQIAVAHSLGLRRVGDVTFQPENAATTGKIRKIAFLLDVHNA